MAYLYSVVSFTHVTLFFSVTRVSHLFSTTRRLFTFQSSPPEVHGPQTLCRDVTDFYTLPPPETALFIPRLSAESPLSHGGIYYESLLFASSSATLSLTHLVHFGNSPIPKPRTLCFSAASVVRRPPTYRSLFDTRRSTNESGLESCSERNALRSPLLGSLARPGERTRSPRPCGQKPARAMSPSPVSSPVAPSGVSLPTPTPA